jgi:hypothetical protein
MKLNSKHLWLFAPVAAVLTIVGCQTSVPPIGSYPAPATAPQYSLVNNFDGNFSSQSGIETNQNLFELNSPNNVIGSPGSWTAPSNGTVGASLAIAGPGAAGSAMACHISGSVTDLGNAAYPQILLIGALDGTPPKTYNAYDGANWTGVKFYVNFASDDTTTYRYFNIPTTQEATAIAFPGQGQCTVSPSNSCYNYFGYSLSGLAPGWQQVTVSFSQLTNIATNTQTTPPTLTGVNLQQIIALQWVVGRNNVVGVSTADFWVDEVYFY